MEPSAPSLGIEQLLAHEGWLRRIIVQLVDRDLVDDVLQDTWAAALAKGGHLVAPRAWLHRVAHNLALARRRTEVRRRQRETAAARHEALPSTASMVERLHAHRQVAEAVAGLDEPYRTVVLLRFVEELPPRAIARRLGLPGSTVRTRIERGLRQVRGRLESADLRALAVVILAPRAGELAAPAPLGLPALNLAIGACTMAARNKTVTAASFVLLLGLGIWLGASPRPDAIRADSGARALAAATAAKTATPAAVAQRRTAVAVATPPAAPALLRGQVLDARGRPRAGVPLLFEVTNGDIDVFDLDGLLPAAGAKAPREIGTSGGDGAFALACPASPGRLRAGGDWVTVRASTPTLAERATREALLVVARATAVDGVVVDDAGIPLADVWVRTLVDGLLHLESAIDSAARLRLGQAHTDGEGRFELTRVPDLEELQLSFGKSGYETVTRHGVVDAGSLHVTLPAAREGEFVVQGTVVDAAGHLVPGATVLLHEALTQTGAYGQFSVRSEQNPAGTRLLAGVAGSQIADGTTLLEPLRGRPAGQLSALVLRLGPPALSVDGRVLDENGAPVADAIVCLFDAHHIQGPRTVEDFVAGREASILNSMKVDARTDDDGRFELGGLSARPYRLRIYDRSTLAGTTVAFEGGQKNLTVLIDMTSRRAVRGVVVSRSGQPLPGLEVRWGLDTFRTPMFAAFAPGTAVTTGEDGAFVLDDIPHGDASLKVNDRSILDLDHDLTGVRDGAMLTLTPWMRCRFRVQIDGPATALRVLDADGEVLELRRTMGPVSVVQRDFTLRGGRSPVLEVSEAASALVVLNAGKEVARHAITLPQDRVTVLSYE